MAKIGRPGLSRQKRAELWERWQRRPVCERYRSRTGTDQGCDPSCLGVPWRNCAGSSPALPGGAGAG